MKNLIKFILAVLVTGTAFTGCSDDNSGETANISIKLVDETANYKEVFVNVVRVEVIVDDEIHQMETNSGTYDLLTLTGGNFVSLVNDKIPAGRLSQMRLILGDGNKLVLKDGEVETEIDLNTPSAQESGLKLNVNYDLQPGVSYAFTMDFDVNRSIVKTGAEGYLLKPVIRVSTDAKSGAISGVIFPAGPATVTATQGEDEISAKTNAAGEFVIFGVPQGTYVVIVDPAEGDNVVEIKDVVVETGKTKDLGEIKVE